MTKSKPILLVEDSEDDALLFSKALEKGGIHNPLSVVTTSQDAIDYLSGEGRFSHRQSFPLPFLVFLDLAIPFTDGFFVLDWIRNHPRHANLPVVVVSGSLRAQDRVKAHAMGAQSYLVKPASAEQLKDLITTLY